jgi:hypothetical protein
MHFCSPLLAGQTKRGGGGERGLLAIFFSWIPAIVRSPLHTHVHVHYTDKKDN